MRLEKRWQPCSREQRPSNSYGNLKFDINISKSSYFIFYKPALSSMACHGRFGWGDPGNSACTQGRMHLPARRSGRGRITSVRSGDVPCKCPAQVRDIAGIAPPEPTSTKGCSTDWAFCSAASKNNCPVKTQHAWKTKGPSVTKTSYTSVARAQGGQHFSPC
jgi:hypothetical protein